MRVSYRIAVLVFALLTILTVEGFAQVRSDQETEINAVLARAEQQLRKGEACFAAGEMDCARRAFDLAVDSFLESGLDVRSNERLYRSWRTIIEKINRYQLDALNDEHARGWKMQEFNELPERLAQAEESDSIGAEEGPLSPEEFQRRFSELQRLFRQKYKRKFIVTGEDHGEHRRLYGAGSAVDVRVRDLDSEQVAFIISTGTRLGLRVKDFSTWDKVELHNARTLNLGRPLDTLATAPHLHIDRMGTTSNGRTSTKVVTVKKRGKGPKPRKNK